MIHGIREEHAVRKLRPEGRQRRVVGNVARREDKSGVLPVQRGKLLLQGKVKSTVSSNVPSTTGTGSIFVQGTTAGDMLG